MNLNELNHKSTANRALKEHYNMPFKLGKLSLSETRAMLHKVRGLINETKQSSNFYRSQTDPSYLKLVFMEQSLSSHFSQLRNRAPTRIVVENEEVEKSQVVLAAQDMVDTVQKMLEQISDMMIKELPALVDSVQSEIGVNESEEFSQQVSDALGSLTSALTQSKTTLQGALNTITGQGGAMADTGAFDAEGEDDAMGGDDMGMGDAEMGDDSSFPEEEPEETNEPAPQANIGRARR